MNAHPSSLSDRELLELAAKAAGIELYYDEDGPNAVTYYGQTKTWGEWNPLEDDGDALRLAVKLELRVVPPWTSGGYKRCRADHIPTGAEGPWVEDVADPYAATRRAIVRAAASLAK